MHQPTLFIMCAMVARKVFGHAWESAHKDGKGFNIQLEGIPFDGRLTMRAASEAK
jgi:hypothetical protein